MHFYILAFKFEATSGPNVFHFYHFRWVSPAYETVKWIWEINYLLLSTYDNSKKVFEYLGSSRWDFLWYTYKNVVRVEIFYYEATRREFNDYLSESQLEGSR